MTPSTTTTGAAAAVDNSYEIVKIRRNQHCLQFVIFILILHILYKDFFIFSSTSKLSSVVSTATIVMQQQQEEENTTTTTTTTDDTPPSFKTITTPGSNTDSELEQTPPTIVIEPPPPPPFTTVTTTTTTTEPPVVSPRTDPPRSSRLTAPATRASGTRANGGGGLFYCGYLAPKIGWSVFPDYAQRHESGYDFQSHMNFIGGSKNENDDAQTKYPRRRPTSQDILIFGMHGPCTSKIERFPGKVLVANGEPEGGNVPARTTLVGRQQSQHVYQIGSVPDDPDHGHTINAYFFAWSPFLVNYMGGDTSALRKLYDHSQKPINTGKYNAMIYTQGACHKHREEAVNEISAIMPIHIGGKCKGARPHKGTYIYKPTPRDWVNNFNVQKEYKFCFAMENGYPFQPHYITEKILNPFLAGCIPIYYGTTEVFDIFNAKAMVYYDPSNPTPALQQLEDLYQNETLYNDMLYNQPILVNGNETIKKYFSLLDEIEGGYLKQRIRTMMGV